MNAKISIIVPVYNTAPWLKRCLDSICSQSYTNLEILCINDGSTDNSAEILAEYEKKDTRIKVFTQANAGLSAARNTGLQHATGEWITGVDSDDYLYPGIYEQAITHCKQDIDMVFFGVQEVDENEKKLLGRHYFQLPQKDEYELTPYLAEHLNVCFWSKLWRRSIIEENSLQFPVGLVHEDEALFWIAAAYIHRIAICHTIGYAYTQRTGSIMNSCGLNQLKRKQRMIPVLEYVHNEYNRRALMKKIKRSYLIRMFVKVCEHVPNGQCDDVHQLSKTVVEKYNMKYAHYKLEKLFPYEKRGILTICRYKRLKVYKFIGIPIWATFYTSHYNKITPSLILSKIINKIKSLSSH